MSEGSRDLPPEPEWDECMSMLEDLPGLPLEQRAEQIERLVRSRSPGVRERALRIGSAVLSDEELVAYMRRESDAVLRNAGLEILKSRGGRSFATAVELLGDDDPAMALQAVQILDHLNDPRAVEPLRALLRHPDPNVVQAAIVAIGHLGDARTIPELLPFLGAEPWLQLAAVQALGSLRSPAAVGPLAELLTDLSIGTLAAEALAQIGGPQAYDVLERHWLRFQEELDPEASLGLLAHVLEGLPKPPHGSPELRASLARRLRDPYRGVRRASARCLLALGEGPEDGEALNILATGVEDDGRLPGCLEVRKDLVDLLLGKPGLLRLWGFRLLARHPEAGSFEAIAAALGEIGPGDNDAVEAVATALTNVRDPRLGSPVLDLYLRLPVEDRLPIRSVLRHHRDAVGAALEARELPAEERAVLAALLGEPPAAVRERIVALPPEVRVAAIAQLAEVKETVRELPWDEWLESEPQRYGDLAARVAASANLRDLLPALRKLLAMRPGLTVVRALGELGDAEALPGLLELLRRSGPLGPVVVEAVGRIGGPEARRALREAARGGDEKLARVAYRALAQCATEEDDVFFREVAVHSDWYVRLAAAEALGRFNRPENLETLSQLAADPVEIVATRARAALEA